MAEPRTWVACKTLPNRENFAAEHIANQKFTYYLPRILESIGKGTQRMCVAKPLFRSYIFVDAGDRWRPLTSTLGVYGLILSGEGPAYIADEELDRIRKLEDENGLVHLPPPPKFANGSKVQVREGAFSGQFGIYEGMAPQDRARVLMDFLGHKTKVLISCHLLEVA